MINKKYIIFLFLTVLIYMLLACEIKPNNSQYYMNLNCEIIEKIPSVPTIGNQQSKAFLIRMIDDTTMYCEYIDTKKLQMTDSVYYNYNIGDTIHFDYINIHKFFKKSH